MEIWFNRPSLTKINNFRPHHPELNAFLSQFEGNNWWVADLRGGENGSGFAWGKPGPRQKLVRHPKELVWVIEAKKEKKGWWQKLLGR